MLSNPLAPNPTQLMAKLRMMPDQELFQYAQLHQNDPYVFPLTFQESNARKAARSAQQMQPGQPPKVVQQDLAQMAPQRAAPRMGGAGAAMPDQMAQAATQPQQAMPEDQGIGQLPAQNMQGMAEGGIVGYAPGGQTMGPGTPADYRQYALEKAAKMGLNPAFVDRIFKIESGYDPLAKSGSGSTGIGQLVKSTAQSYGLKTGKQDERLNPIMNIDASLAYMADLNKKYKGNPQLIAVAYNQGEPTLDAHLRKNGGKLVPEKLQQEIAANLKDKGKLTDAQIAARAAEPVNYLNKLNNTAIPNEASLGKGESIEPPTQAVDNSVPTNYRQEQAAQDAAQQAAQQTADNESVLDKLKKGVRNFVGNVETGVSALGGMTTYPTAAIAAAAQNPKGAKDAAQGLATPEAAAYYKLMDDLRSQATYAPRTPEGQAQLEQLNKTMSGLPPYMGTMVGAKPTQLRTTAAPKAVTKPGLPSLVESPAAKTVEAPAPVEPAVSPEVAAARAKQAAARAAVQTQVGKPKPTPQTPVEAAQAKQAAARAALSKDGPEIGNRFFEPEAPTFPITPESLAAREAAVAKLRAAKPKPAPAEGTTFPIEPENAGLAAAQRAKLALEQQAEEARRNAPPAEEPVAKPVEAAAPPVEETPSAMTPEEMLARAQNYELDKQKAAIIRNRQTAVEAGLPGLVNPVTTTPPASTAAATKDTGGFDTSGFENLTMPDTSKSEEDTTAPPTAEAPKKGGMDYNDLMIKMGLGMMAGKSPHALVNVGEAGLGALQMTAAEKKAAAEQAYHEALAEQARAHAAYYPGMLAQKMAGLDAKQRVAVETETARLMASYKNNPMYMTNPAALQQMEMSVREGVMNRIMGQSQPTAAAPVAVPQGVTVKQIG